MAEDPGVEIPKGHPDALRTAGGGWASLGGVLEEQASRMGHAAAAVVTADWSGESSQAYSGFSGVVSIGFTEAAAACRRARQACARFARELEDAQHRARAARRAAEDAIGRRDRARRQVDAAQGRIDAAERAAQSAAHRATVAAAAGPAGAHSLAIAQGDALAAGRERSDAEGDLRRAQGAVKHAEDDLDRARREGRHAKHDADTAAHVARQAFSAVAAAVPQLPLAGAPTVPVSLRGARPEIAAMNPVSGGPFRVPGRFATPGQARAAQMARVEAAAQAQQAPPSHKGSIWDGLAGAVNGFTFGLVDVGGDKSSDRYRGGEVASMLPITPTGMVRSGGRLIEREVAHGIEHELARDGGAGVSRLWKPREVLGTTVHQRDDLIDPLRTDKRGRTNLQRMAKGDPPIGPDGQSINLHHTTQQHGGALAEVEATFHTDNRRVLHVNWPPHKFPSGINRPAFEAWKKRYWEERGIDFTPGNDAP